MGTQKRDNQKKELTQSQYNVLREGGTEPPFTGKYYKSKEKGLYQCAGCGTKLFSSETKLEPGTEPVGLQGWPSFDQAIPGSVEYKEDTSMGMQRTEVVCSSCGGHLGHVFDDSSEETGKHYCINSCSLDFEKE